MQRFAVLARVMNGVNSILFGGRLFRKHFISRISDLIDLTAFGQRARLVGTPQRA
jgi:hypothetical protein